jgi:hypothetical protein
VGQVTLVSVLKLDTTRWEKWRDRHLALGIMPRDIFGWILRDAVRFAQPVAARGKLGLFVPSEADLKLLQTQLR